MRIQPDVSRSLVFPLMYDLEDGTGQTQQQRQYICRTPFSLPGTVLPHKSIRVRAASFIPPSHLAPLPFVRSIPIRPVIPKAQVFLLRQR